MVSQASSSFPSFLWSWENNREKRTQKSRWDFSPKIISVKLLPAPLSVLPQPRYRSWDNRQPTIGVQFASFAFLHLCFIPPSPIPSNQKPNRLWSRSLRIPKSLFFFFLFPKTGSEELPSWQGIHQANEGLGGNQTEFDLSNLILLLLGLFLLCLFGALACLMELSPSFFNGANSLRLLSFLPLSCLTFSPSSVHVRQDFPYLVPLVTLLLQPFSLASSSFVEEEHQSWLYFMPTTLAFLFFMKRSRFLFLMTFSLLQLVANLFLGSSTKERAQLLVCLILFRIARSWNPTGEKWPQGVPGQVPFIRDWLLSPQHEMYLALGPVICFLVLVCLFSLFFFKRSPSIRPGFISTSFLCLNNQSWIQKHTPFFFSFFFFFFFFLIY